MNSIKKVLGAGFGIAVLTVLVMWAGSASAATCNVVASKPIFPLGGNVLGLTPAQLSTVFGAKADANNGILCNSILSGRIDLTNAQVLFPSLPGTGASTIDILGNGSTSLASPTDLRLAWGTGFGQTCSLSVSPPTCTISNQAIFGPNAGYLMVSPGNHGTAAGLSNATNGNIPQVVSGAWSSVPFPGPTSVAPTSANDLAVWNSTAGGTVRAGPPAQIIGSLTGAITSFGANLKSQSQSAVTAETLLGTSAGGFQNWDALRGVSVETNGTTVINTIGVGGYVENAYNSSATAVAGGYNSVALFGLGVVDPATTNSNVWSLNTVVTDTVPGAGASIGTHTLVGYELDINNVSTHNMVEGIGITGGSVAQPASSFALTIEPMNAASHSFPWSTGLSLADGCCTTALTVPALSFSGSTISGAPIFYYYFNSSGVEQHITAQATPVNGLAFSGTAGTNGGIVTFAGPTVFAGQTGTPTGAACFSSTGVLLNISSCTVSAARYKNVLDTLDQKRATYGIDHLYPIVFNYKDNKAHGSGTHVGLLADDVARMDQRCGIYDGAGKIDNYEDRCVLAYLVDDVKQLRAEVTRLESRH